jgi:polar amino acid transport system permease protein
MLIGIFGGLLLVIAILSNNIVWANLANAYISLLRSLPLIILLLIFYNIAIFLPQINLGIPFTEIGYQFSTNKLITPFIAAVLGLALHEAAYMAEIIRAGINGVDTGQNQAAESLGMTFIESLRWVVLPQAVRIIIPPTANQFISMLKNTSLVVVIAGNDLLTVAKSIYSVNYLTMELLFVASIWYLVMVLIFTYGTRYLEARFSRGF